LYSYSHSHFHCHSDIDDSDNDDGSYNKNESSDNTDGTDESKASDEASSISDDKLQGLDDDLKMPASAKKPAKKSTTPKKVAVEEITELASGLAISSGTKSSWYSPTYQFPYVVYAFKDENHPVGHCVVEFWLQLCPTSSSVASK
jgi:hypothetical protein